MAIVALAGPLTNLILAFGSALLFHLMGVLPQAATPWLAQTLSQSILLNLVLAIFNMIPVPPLDGSRVVLSILPGAVARQYAKLERFGFLILLGIIFLLPVLGRQIGVDLDLFGWLVGIPLAGLAPIFFRMAGIE